MGSPEWKYWSLKGRIGRKSYILGMIAVNVVPFLVIYAFYVWLGFRLADADSISELVIRQNAQARVTAWLTVVFHCVVLWPNLALAVKRRHDRNKSGWDVAAMYLLQTAILLLYALGIDWTVAYAGIQPYPKFGPLLLSLMVIWTGLNSYLTILLLWFRGTRGPNKYGPDPVSAGIGARQAYA